jgi:hypothetical protein
MKVGAELAWGGMAVRLQAGERRTTEPLRTFCEYSQVFFFFLTSFLILLLSHSQSWKSINGVNYVDSSMAVEVQLSGFWVSRFEPFLP